jgi:hypothetical protein
MWDTFARIAIVAAFVVAIAWLIANARYVFWVRIRNGVPSVGRGKVAAPFLRDLVDVCAQYPIERGWVGGVRYGRRIQLAFSHSIPERCRQQLRNLWNLHR